MAWTLRWKMLQMQAMEIASGMEYNLRAAGTTLFASATYFEQFRRRRRDSFRNWTHFTPFYSSNVMQFFESDTMFDDTGAYLDAQLPEPDANYTIQLYDPSTTPATLIKTITGSTSSGMIQENWDLTYDDGTTLFTNDTVNAVFNVNLLDPASAQAQKYCTS